MARILWTHRGGSFLKRFFFSKHFFLHYYFLGNIQQLDKFCDVFDRTNERNLDERASFKIVLPFNSSIITSWIHPLINSSLFERIFENMFLYFCKNCAVLQNIWLCKLETEIRYHSNSDELKSKSLNSLEISLFLFPSLSLDHDQI